jgi:hypothetical protein
MAMIFLFVGFSVSYILFFVNFARPESTVDPSFEIGFSLGLLCALAVGFFVNRHFWREYSKSEPE